MKRINASSAVTLLGLLGLMAAAGAASAAATCDEYPMSWQAAYVNDWSEWHEFDAAGHKLVHESGQLQGVEVSAGVRCGDWRFQAQLAQLEGSRLYDGQTSNGVLITSRSALHQLQGHLQASWSVSEAWQLGARWSGQTLWRDIASAGGASGYPERYDWTLFSLGAQWQVPLGSGQLTLATWVGTPLTSSMQVSLPGRDSATLALGSINQFELSAGWATQLGPAWHLLTEARYRRTDMAQGPVGIIRRNGVPVGGAYQPRTSMTDSALVIGLRYQF